MNTNNGGNVLGRIVALFLIAGAAYGAHAIARGSFGCAMSGGCCMMETPAASESPAAPEPTAPAKPQ